MSKPEKLVEVYRAGSQTEAEVIKSMLESFNIPCVLRDFGALNSQGAVDFGKVSIMCLEPMADQARELLDPRNIASQDDEDK